MASEHKRIVRRLDGLEARADRHDHAHDIAARLRGASEEKINARMDDIEAALNARLLAPDVDDSAAHIELGSRFLRLSERVDVLDKSTSARLAALEAKVEAGDVTSTVAPKRMKRWIIVSGGCALSAGMGFVSGGHARPTFFRTRAQAEVVRDLLFECWAEIPRVEEVEVIERDGRLIEARYA